MRYRATLGNPKKPKERISVSFLAKSEKAAKAKLRKLFPGLGSGRKANPRPRGSSQQSIARKKAAIKRQLRSMGYEFPPDMEYTLSELRTGRKQAFRPHIYTKSIRGGTRRS